MEDNKIQIYEDQQIRTAWDEEKQEWYGLSFLVPASEYLNLIGSRCSKGIYRESKKSVIRRSF